MSARAETLLFLAGASSAGIALLHFGMIPFGAPAYRWFGAPEAFAVRAESGSAVPALVTAGIGVVFALSAVWPLAAAGRLRRPPLLRTGLVAISAIYLLRGLSAFSQGIYLLIAPGPAIARYFAFSLAALVVGVLHAAGTTIAWHTLTPPRQR